MCGGVFVDRCCLFNNVVTFVVFFFGTELRKPTKKKKKRKCIRGDPFSEQECISSLQIIRSNCVQAIFTLLQKADEMYNRGEKECFVDYEDAEIRSMVMELHRWWKRIGQRIFDIGFTSGGSEFGEMTHKKKTTTIDNNDSEQVKKAPLSSLEEKELKDNAEGAKGGEFSKIFPFSEETSSYDWDAIERMGGIIAKLWNLQGVRHCFLERQCFGLPDNMDYYLDKVEAVMKFDYVCTSEDCLKVSSRTTGFCSYHYEDDEIQGYQFFIYDLGGAFKTDSTNFCVYICTYTYTYIYIYVYAYDKCIYMYMYVCVHIYTCQNFFFVVYNVISEVIAD
ncbi:hypothetical protein RFI_07466 [Reticulomyxa filosa]|uniref:Uncharacterized protein n=1 Tax=Reticulomyxa filosa TaxID=46433 RepID=X6NWJ7_RETFI|nr:hypothetical protein RFI_07466 [Reticulomyxa filosa]|eukprot:ETO29657.1 hypothetical protein RFI_07466 [Reticulomyxa filosa]